MISSESRLGCLVLVGCLLFVLSGATGCRSTRDRGQVPEYASPTPADKALAKRAEAVINAAGTSPGREYANFLRTRPRPRWLEHLRGERSSSPNILKIAAKDIRGIVELAEKGLSWPRPPLVRVPFASDPVTVDGKLDEAAWQNAVTYHDIYKFNSAKKLNKPKTTWRILWDHTHLYFAFECEDTDLAAKNWKRDDTVYSDDCVEMFILPEFRFRTYWELVISPSGSVFDSVECKHVDKWGAILDPSQNMTGLKFAIDVRGTLNQPGDIDEGYTVEVAVPFAELPGYNRIKPDAGSRLHFMLVRIDRQGETVTPYSYQPLLGWGHNIWNHAVMELAK